jgi:hypothetical protein
MWKGRLCCLRFPRKRIIPGVGVGDYCLPSFPRPRHGQWESLEQFAFGLLHTLRGCGVAVGCGDASQDGQSETRTQVLLGLGQGEQGLQRRAGIPAALALVRSRDKSALEFGLRTEWFRWRSGTPGSAPGSVSPLRAHGWSILSMPSPSGSSCIGILPPLQAHLVLVKTKT